jgi:hypothetical protein
MTDTSEAAVDQEMKGEAEDTGAASASNVAAERRSKVFLETTVHSEPPRPALAGIGPVTPMKRGDSQRDNTNIAREHFFVTQVHNRLIFVGDNFVDGHDPGGGPGYPSIQQVTPWVPEGSPFKDPADAAKRPPGGDRRVEPESVVRRFRVNAGVGDGIVREPEGYDLQHAGVYGSLGVVQQTVCRKLRGTVAPVRDPYLVVKNSQGIGPTEICGLFGGKGQAPEQVSYPGAWRNARHVPSPRYSFLPPE